MVLVSTDSAHLNQRAGEIENLGNLLDSLRGTHTEEAGDETAFYKALSDNYPVGQNIVFDDISDITAEQSRLDGIVQSLTNAEKTHQDEIAERDAFFDISATPAGAGSAFANVGEIEAEVNRLEKTQQLWKGLPKLK